MVSIKRLLSIAAFSLISASPVFALAEQPAAQPSEQLPRSVIPDTPKSEWASKWWPKRHKAKIDAKNSMDSVDLVFLGDSITANWERKAKDVWDEYYTPRNALNLGFSGDRTEHILWRIQNGAIDGISPKLLILMAGTNNSGQLLDSPEEIAQGVQAILATVDDKLPETQVLVLGIFPRGATPDDRKRKLNEGANEIIKGFADNERFFYLNINDHFLKADGTLTADVMADLVHPNADQYRIWAEAMEPAVKRLMKE